MQMKPIWKKSLFYFLVPYPFLVFCAFHSFQIPVFASVSLEERKELSLLSTRKELFETISFITEIPWYLLAAIDQYERTMLNKKEIDPTNRITAITIPADKWSGPLNPDPKDTNLISISYYGGIGKDGSGDGVADRNNDLDVLASIVNILLSKEILEEDFYTNLWDYYQNPRSVDRIKQFARIYFSFQTMDFQKFVFPVPMSSDYAYRSTWGAKRGWGGRRIHEGIDIFAKKGTPVRSTSYGVVEEMGWNIYGGWRIGIRDIQNRYHYYAHLSGFDKKIKMGEVIKPGKVIGWLGNSGYGKPGTIGKFPPHLHYGIYMDKGYQDWPFDPFPLLRRWEQSERKIQ